MDYTYNSEEMINLLDDSKNKDYLSFKEVFSFLAKSNNDLMDVAFRTSEDNHYVHESLTLLSPLLITGCTGTGKTNLINTIITTLIMRNTPDDLKLVLIDDKQVELAAFDSLPHLYCPRIIDREKVIEVLDELIIEKKRRLNLFKEANVDYIYQYNQNSKNVKLPNIAIFIDEYIDLIVSLSEFKDKIISLINDADKVGIYIIMSTQNPNKKSLPDDLFKHLVNCISFKQSSKQEFKRIIPFLGDMNNLKEKGDIYLFANYWNLPVIHLQTPYISYEEIDKIVTYIKEESNKHE